MDGIAVIMANISNLQTYICSDMEGKISARFQARSLYCDNTQLCNVVILWIALPVVVIVIMTFVHSAKHRKVIVGPICIVFNILMYVSPLTVMRQVIRTKSVKYMPFLLSLANFVNGVVWTTYALLKWDPFVAVPNGLGTLSGLVQLILYAVYYRKTKWHEDAPPCV
ncbi:Bidirectional sugar transporter SWEET5 [Spatholobus suberectus]|nr:Bidirectional sugar transporter SWEET5 [Spatholobus suberectus]